MSETKTPEGFNIIDPPGLKGGPGAQMKALQKYLREYHGPFRVEGDNPPMVVAKDGEAMLSMMWPVHDQTPEGEQAAVDYLKATAEQIAELLNNNSTLERQNAELTKRVDAARAAIIYAREKSYSHGDDKAADHFDSILSQLNQPLP